MTLFELDEAANEIRAEVASDANVIVGSNFDENLEGKLRISVVAAGLEGAQAGLKPAEALTNDNGLSQPEFVAPIVVTQTKVETETPDSDRTEVDSRPDFEGRDLPAAHSESSAGDEHVAAGAVFGARPDHASNDEPAQEQAPKELETEGKAEVKPGQSGFGNLFGWQRRSDNTEPSEKKPEKEAIVSSPDDHPEPAPFDDADLEIPAFLRRSANH